MASVNVQSMIRGASVFTPQGRGDLGDLPPLSLCHAPRLGSCPRHRTRQIQSGLNFVISLNQHNFLESAVPFTKSHALVTKKVYPVDWPDSCATAALASGGIMIIDNLDPSQL